MKESPFPCRAVIRGWIFACVLTACPFAWPGEVVLPRAPVTAQQAWQAVVDELRSRGFGPEQLPRVEDVELPSAIPAYAGQQLRVSSACWDSNGGRARFRLECRDQGACLPFLVYARVPAHAQAASCRTETQARSLPAASKPAVRAGDRATAVAVAGGLRMTAAVTCLERGREGDIIRVRGQGGRIFRARVTGPARVEAMLQ